MIQDRIIYTDGHTVTITDSMFQVKNTEYRLNGITKHGLHVLKPHRLPGILMVVLGIVLIIVGFANLIPSFTEQQVLIGDSFVQMSTILWIGGVVIALIGILLVGLIRERYAVRIATAEGEKDVVVSRQKEYITQIVNALSSAYNYLRKGYDRKPQ